VRRTHHDQEEDKMTRRTTFIRPSTVLFIALVVVGAMLTTTASAAPAASKACAVCGKNLIKNPGAEAGAGITAVGAYGAVPGWSNEAGQFTAASYTFPNGWFSKTTKGSPKRGKNYFFGGTTTEANTAKATIGKQTIKLEREFNRRAGFTKEDDRIPKWMTEEALPENQSVFDVKEEDLDNIFSGIE